MTPRQHFFKRSIDLLGAILGLFLTWWLILLAWIGATVDTRRNGLFTQQRIGRHGKAFRVLKIRTMREVPGHDTTVTKANDVRITRLGALFRRLKVDELPQIWNVLVGEMSFVGPRPDVPSFADRLEGEDRVVLSIRPGITGPATLKYRDEETLLATVEDPERYNREVLWPDKVRINRDYILNWSLTNDLKLIGQTFWE